MDALRRFRDWWLGQFRKTGRLGKIAWVGTPLLFGCCFCWTALLIVVPSPDVEPTAAVALRAESTVATGETVATQELVEATAAPIEEPTETVAPSRTTAPTRTAAVTSTEESATARPSATMQATNTPQPRATATSAPSATAESAAPTRALFALSGQIDIIAINPDEEYVDLQNVAGEDIMLTGWVLRFGDASEDCSLDLVGLFPDGYTLRVWVVERPPTYAEHSCALAAGTLSDADAETLVLADASGYEIGRVTVVASSRAVATNVATAVPPITAPPTVLPQPTATLPTAVGQLVITTVNKREEFVDIQNTGGTEVVLDDWTLRSEKGPQDCRLSGVLGPGQALRIWAMTEDAGQGGFNCGMGSEIWNNSEPDAAVLINPEGAEVSRR